MPTPPHESLAPPHPSDQTGTRLPLRLALGAHPGADTLDGGWWPQSRDLAVEVADLVDHLPPATGGVVHAHVSAPDWDPPLRRVPVRGGALEVSTSHDDPHVVVLRTSDRTGLRLLVVPPDVSEDDGHEALLAASTNGNKHDALALLQTVADSPPVDPAGFWPAGSH